MFVAVVFDEGNVEMYHVQAVGFGVLS